MKTGAELIAEERNEHFTKHVHTLERDRQYVNKELLYVAAYILTGDYDYWPESWSTAWLDKFDGKESEVDRLAVAGSLIAAEIDRIQNRE